MRKVPGETLSHLITIDDYRIALITLPKGWDSFFVVGAGFDFAFVFRGVIHVKHLQIPQTTDQTSVCHLGMFFKLFLVENS